MGISEVDQNSILSNYFSGGGKAKRVATSKVREVMANTPGYKNLKYIEKHIDGLVKSKEGILNGRQILNLKDDINDLTGVKKSSKNLRLGILEQNVTNLSKLAAKNTDDVIIALPGNKQFQKAKKAYSAWTKLKGWSQEFFGDKDAKGYLEGKATENTVNKLVRGSKQMEGSAILDTAEKLGLPLEKKGRDIRTLQDFYDPSLSPLSDTVATASRTIPAAALGAAGGYFAGEAAGGGAVKRQAGSLLGSLFGMVGFGPKGVKFQAKQLNRASRAKKWVGKHSPVSAPQVGNIWGQLQQGNGNGN